MPPARVCFFKPSSLAKGILFANFRPFCLGRVYFLASLVKEMSNFGNSCKETQIFFKFWSLECKNWSSQGYHFQKNWSSQRCHFETVGGTPLSEIQPRTPPPSVAPSLFLLSVEPFSVRRTVPFTVVHGSAIPPFRIQEQLKRERLDGQTE